MRLSKVEIENFRSISKEEIYIDNYSCLVGPNGTGKSNILNALNVFFHNNDVNFNVSTLSKEDFFNKVTKDPIKITLEFENLNEEARGDFKAYYRNGKLRIIAKAVWDENRLNADVKHYGERYVMKDFAKYFRADKNGAYAKDLKDIYSDLRKEYDDLPKVTTKGDMKNALREFEENHTELCELMESEDQFYGISRGANKLEKYIQWVYIPAVKDAATEQEEERTAALKQLLDRTIRSKIDFSDSLTELEETIESEYKDIINKESEVLEGLSLDLQTRLREWSHPGTKLDLNWYYDPDKSIAINEPIAKISIGEDNFIGEISRSGHGLQRSFIIAILQELAMGDDEETPTLILGFEEPELYQHPPQARHIQRVLENLANNNSQIILATHSPYFVSSDGFESIRKFTKNRVTNETVISQTKIKNVSELIGGALEDTPPTPSTMTAKIEQIMQPSQNELYFTSIAILVEGVEDIAYITTHLLYTEKWQLFRRYGCHFIVCEGKTNLSRPLAIAKSLDIPVFVVFDADSDKKKNEEKEKNIRDNTCILNLLGIDEFDPLPNVNYWNNNVLMWSTNIGKEIKQEYGSVDWDSEFNQFINENNFSNLRASKNSYVLNRFINSKYVSGWRSELLEQLSKNIIDFAKSNI
jgi:predicted ATP-dependent endonuclease of OLD family